MSGKDKDEQRVLNPNCINAMNEKMTPKIVFFLHGGIAN